MIVQGLGGIQRYKNGQRFRWVETKNPMDLPGSSDFLFSHWPIEIIARDSVERQFDATGDAELVIDRAQVVSNCMLGEGELVADIPRA